MASVSRMLGQENCHQTLALWHLFDQPAMSTNSTVAVYEMIGFT